MVGSNKILTVSYGTFSCTLEGFDDSFHSMKAIAEYFRDLAQDDRYFGAEPPTPDAEMLARIAEREISRRVEAEMDDRGIRLRAAPQAATAALEAAADAGATSEAAPETPTAAAEDIAAPAADAPAEVAMSPGVDASQTDTSSDTATASAFMTSPSAEAPTPTPVAFTPAEPGSFAAKLQRIRSVVGTPAPATEEAESFDDVSAMPFDEDADVTSSEDVFAADTEFAAEDILSQGPDADIVEDDLAEPDHDVDVSEKVEIADAVKLDAADDKTDADETDDVLADVSTDDADTLEGSDEQEASDEAPQTETSESDDAEDVDADEVAEDDTQLDAEDAAWAMSALADATPEDEEQATTDAGDTDHEVLSSDLTDTDMAEASDDADADLSSDLNDIDVPEAAEAPDAQSTSQARIVRIGKDGPTEIISGDGAEEADANVTATLKTDAAEDEPAEVADLSDPLVSDDAFSETAEDNNADVSVDDIPEAAEFDDADEAHDGIRAAIAAAMPTGSLSDEDEDDLQRELAAVAEDVVVLEDETPEVEEVVVEDAAAEDVVSDEADTSEDTAAEAASDTDEDDNATEVADIPEVVQSRPKSRKKLPDADYAVTRMIAQTDEALNEPAGSRRRNAIAQLKAAVAATEAARQLGDESGSAAEAENAFRDDLDQVVRPSRPLDPNDENDRPRASPLKLVASQRVDSEPVPTRSTPKIVDAADVGGFAQFADSMGATELPDLLEAAAAYTSFVEGIEDFSRPQIMKKVQMTTTEEFSREDGLRSFGTLLRQGRISKVRNGRFQVSEQTRFRPDARSA